MDKAYLFANHPVVIMHSENDRGDDWAVLARIRIAQELVGNHPNEVEEERLLGIKH